MYKLSKKIQEHFYHPKNVGELDVTKNNVKMVEVATADGYTRMQLFVELAPSVIEIITAAKFKVLGCPSAIACLSFVTDYLIGKDLQACKDITVEFLVKALDLPKEKYSVAGLVEDLVRQL